MARHTPTFTLQILGHLGQDPINRAVNDSNVTNFNVATNRDYTDRDGVKHERTEWTRVVCWDGLGTITARYLKKGRQVLVEGAPKATAYIQTEEDGTQTAMPRLELIANSVIFLGSHPEGSDDKIAPPLDTPTDEEIPF